MHVDDRHPTAVGKVGHELVGDLLQKLRDGGKLHSMETEKKKDYHRLPDPVENAWPLEEDTALARAALASKLSQDPTSKRESRARKSGEYFPSTLCRRMSPSRPPPFVPCDRPARTPALV